MIQRKDTFFLGIFIFLIPFLGVPTSWKTLFITLSGLGLVAISLRVSLPKKQFKIRTKKDRITPVFVENSPLFSTENKIEPKIEPEVFKDTPISPSSTE